MKQNDLENLFRNRLRSDRPKVDTDRLWQKLEDKLPSGNKRRPPFFGWLSGIGIIILLGAMIWWSNTLFHENENALSSVSEAPIPGSAPEDNVPHTKDPSLFEQQPDQNHTLALLRDPDLNQDALLSDHVVNENRMNARFESANNTEAERREPDGSEDGSENAERDLRKTGSDFAQENRHNTGTVPGVMEVPGVKHTTADPASNQGVFVAPEMIRQEMPVSDPDGISVSERTDGSRQEDPAYLPEEFLPGSAVPPSLTALNGELIFPVAEKKKGLLTLDEIPDFPKVSASHRRHSLSMFMGIGLTVRQLEALTREGIEEKGYRETTERMLENWTAALAYRYQPGKWYLEASVSGGWFGEKVNSVSVTTDSLTLDNVVIEQILENGQVIEERRGQVTMIETTERRVLSYPKLFHLQAGLGVGRSWALGKNTSLQTGVGVLYSFYHQYHRGTLALQPDLLYELDRNEDNRFSDDGMQFGGYLSADLCLRFSSKWSGSAGLRISAWPKGIAGESAPVQQRYQSYSLTLGIGRHF